MSLYGNLLPVFVKCSRGYSEKQSCPMFGMRFAFVRTLRREGDAS